MVAKIATRGPKIGTCNICGIRGELSHDHVPPKGSIRITQVEMLHLVGLVNADKPRRGGRLSQDGVKFRSLCSRCNNRLLGARYDPAFIEFTGYMGRFLKASVAIPRLTSIPGRPQRLMRAVLGHMMAVGLDRHDKGSQAITAAEYFLDETKNLPRGIDIFYWFYPYNDQVLIRDAVLRDLTVKEPLSFWLMKFFPVAFLVTWDRPDSYRFDYPNLAKYGTLGIDGQVELPLYLDKVPHQRWPEMPTKHTFLLYGEGAMGAKEKPKRERRGS